MELREALKESFPRGHKKVGQGYSSVVNLCTKKNIPRVTVAYLLSSDLWKINRFHTVRKDQSQIYGRGCLEFYFQELVPDIGKPPIVLVSAIAKLLAHSPVQLRASVPFLIIAPICKICANESSQALEYLANW